ncbi:MAG: 4Fe-4S dicluster domain-containing protein [Desulfobacterales bacterium]|nr:MAG: 4Fe-4S dicluster domain-containing protein [Desulfobacterales bacterium]
MQITFFTFTLYLSLAICLIGLTYRGWTWLKLEVGPPAERFSCGQRAAAAAQGLLRTLLSRRIFAVLKVLVLDVGLQVRILKADLRRWCMHMSIFVGVLLLVLMHALDEPLTQALFPDYASTRNPFMFLRNLGGAMVLAGVGLALYRRVRIRGLRRTTRTGDRLAMGLLALIIFSGFVLEGLQIISAPIFDQMVEDYLGTDDPEDRAALKVYWAQDFGVAFSGLKASADAEVWAQGQDLHEESCAGCHSNPRAAFVSYPLARALQSMAGVLNGMRADVWMWYVHFLACFGGLAVLPFTKFFHLIATPLQLLVGAVENPSPAAGANQQTKRVLGLDACMHCGVCTLHCSVEPVFRIMGNPSILPSEKLASVKTLAAGRLRDPEALAAVAAGSFICTSCYRCTRVCPAGIDLQDLWSASRQSLVARGFTEPHIWVRERTAAEWAAGLIAPQASPFPALKNKPRHVNLVDQTETFSACVQCQTCTNVCPVVAAAGDSARDLDLTPQQIMNLLRLGAHEMAMGARMVWDCVTCYMCQEHCPQGVKVADVMYELRNRACERLPAVKQAVHGTPLCERSSDPGRKEDRS